MATTLSKVNSGGGTIALLKNVTNCFALVEELKSRGAGRQRMGTFFGYSGYGKTYAADYVQNKTNGRYIEVRDFWTKKKFAENLLKELGVAKPRGSIGDMIEEAVEIIGEEPGRPLIIDEADKLVDKGLIETIRDIYALTSAPILLIGEELLPQKLKAYERVDNRILKHVPAQPSDAEDTGALAEIYYPNIRFGADLLAKLREESTGQARRIVTNLDYAAEAARNKGIEIITLTDWNGPYHTGDVPRRTKGKR